MMLRAQQHEGLTLDSSLTLCPAQQENNRPCNGPCRTLHVAATKKETGQDDLLLQTPTTADCETASAETCHWLHRAKPAC